MAAFIGFVKVKLNIFEDILLQICLGVVKENKIINFPISYPVVFLIPVFIFY